ncbi:hypothetical protein MJO29_004164, partial [Puccinia striiformis f. sp. tritici]
INEFYAPESAQGTTTAATSPHLLVTPPLACGPLETILKPAMHLNPHYYLLAGTKKPSMMSNRKPLSLFEVATQISLFLLTISLNHKKQCATVSTWSDPESRLGGFARLHCTNTGYLDDDDVIRTLYSLHSSQLKRSLNIKISVWHSDQEATILFPRTWLNQPFNVLFDSKKTQHLTTHYKFFTGTKKPSMMSNVCNSTNLVRPRVKIGGVRKTSLHKNRISRRRRLRTLYSLHSSQLKRSLNIKISVWHSDQEATILFPRTWLNQPFNVLFDSKKTQHLTTHYKFFTGTKKPSMMSNVCNSTNLARPRVKIWGFRKTSLHEHRISRRRRRESIRTRVLERLKPDANLFPLASPYSSQPALHPSHPEVQRQESSTHVETGLNDNAWFDESTANLPHHPGPYEEIDFGLPHYQDEQLQPDVTSSIQQPTQTISSDFPGPDQGPSNQVETGLNDSKSLAKQSHGDHHIDAHRAKSTIQFSPQLQKDSWFDEYTANLPQHPGPYKEFDFSVLFDKEVQIQPQPTSSNQQPMQTNSTDLPGLSYEATPQEYEPRPMQVEPSQTPNVLGEGRQSAMGLRGTVASSSNTEISGHVPVPGLRRRRRGLLPRGTRGVGLQIPRLHEEMGCLQCRRVPSAGAWAGALPSNLQACKRAEESWVLQDPDVCGDGHGRSPPSDTRPAEKVTCDHHLRLVCGRTEIGAGEDVGEMSTREMA